MSADRLRAPVRASGTPPGGEGGKLRSPAAALLVGGASSRMGRDKAHLELGGRALATHTAELLDRLFAEVLLVGGEPPAAAPGRRVRDPEGPRSALRGIVAALSAARADRVLVVATDMPGLGAELLLALVAAPEAAVVVPRHEERLHPLCAIYARDAVLPTARAALGEERLGLRALLASLDQTRLEGDDLAPLAPEHRLANCNTPEDWEAFVRAGGAA